MADLTQSAVTFEESGYIASSQGKLRRVQVTLALTGQGDVINTIPASVLSLGRIEEASAFVADDDSAAYLAAPSYDGSKLLLFADGSDNPISVNDTVRGVVTGKPE